MRFGVLGAFLVTSSVAASAQAQAPAPAEPADDAEIDSAPSTPPAVEPAPVPAPDAAAAPPAAKAEVTTAPAPLPPVAPAAPAPAQALAPPPEKAEPAAKPEAATPLVDISGYVQAEYQLHQDSEDQLRQGGTLLNQNRFLIRRARVGFKRAWDFSSLELELDGNTTNGPSFGVYRAEASLFYRGHADKTRPPMLQLTAGMFRTPFGYEVQESSSKRWFVERSLLTRAFWPNEIDVGARLSGQISVFRAAVAVTNGEPLGQRSGFPGQDPNSNKDVTLNVGVRAPLAKNLEIAGGVSGNTGKGMHLGTGATKSTLAWRDANENGLIENGELIGAASQAETPSQNFDRFAIGADLQLYLKTKLGESALLGELITAKNLDRGFFPADPLASQQDLREFGFYVGFLQAITEYGMVGLRFDYYDPNADSAELHGGKIVPTKNTVRTLSPIVGLQLPGRARFVAEWDVIRDHLARDTTGVPTDLRNDTWTFRLQVNL